LQEKGSYMNLRVITEKQKFIVILKVVLTINMIFLVVIQTRGEIIQINKIELSLEEKWVFKQQEYDNIYGVSFVSLEDGEEYIVFNYKDFGGLVDNISLGYVGLSANGTIKKIWNLPPREEYGTGVHYGFDFDGQFIWQTYGYTLYGIDLHALSVNKSTTKEINVEDISFNDNSVWCVSQQGELISESLSGEEQVRAMIKDVDTHILGLTIIEEYVFLITENNELILYDPYEKEILWRVDTPSLYRPWGVDYNGSHLALILRDSKDIESIHLFKLDIERTAATISITSYYLS